MRENDKNDDWHEETQLRLSESSIYLRLKEKCANAPGGSHVMALVDDATYYAYQRTKSILRHMGEYTLHDGEHLFRVLKLMSRLISDEDVQKLTIPELMLLILGAFFHDIGMAPDEKLVISWKKIWDKQPIFEDDLEEKECAAFERFFNSSPDLVERLTTSFEEGDQTAVDSIKAHVISEYIRSTHADRARQIVERDWSGKIVFQDLDLTSELASICFSHNEDPLSILDLEMDFPCDSETFSCLPLVALLLRLADILDFDAKRTPEVLFAHLYVRNPVSVMEWQKHRAIKSWSISQSKISFLARCKHPAIESAIHSFCDLIDVELGACNNVVSKINDYDFSSGRRFNIQLPFRVDRSNITTAKNIQGNPLYSYKETRFSLSKSQVVGLLMGTKLYGNPEVALRELIQNSIDACLLRQALEESWGNPYVPEIRVEYRKEGNDVVLEVEDNGTGMDQDIVDQYYSNLGKSFYKSRDFFELKSKYGATFKPTSRFGIGVLSCFMVSDSVEVDTRRVYGPHESSLPLNLVIEGQESIFWIKEGMRDKPGTSTRLTLRKKQNPWADMSSKEFIDAVANTIPNPRVKIAVKSDKKSRTLDQSSFKKITAKSLKKWGWDDQPNVDFFELDFPNSKNGFVGSAIVAILQKHNMPVRDIHIQTQTVEIDRVDYELEKSMSMSGEQISTHSTSISIDEDGCVESSEGSSVVCSSVSRLSLHGIEVPMSLFPDYWRKQKNQVSLNWPFPMLVVLDVGGEFDLDLNASRTAIIASSRWNDFELTFSNEVLSELRKQMSDVYWGGFMTYL
ncbi:hypothetical protein NT6N_39020 [Oceaniferula spumae]|uniref:HD/PDEase domain-containing protein n=1 Tax=Oceaniferula spumae TaxID=2979115 RepID=A0AAT9FS89_9BACT